MRLGPQILFEGSKPPGLIQTFPGFMCKEYCQCSLNSRENSFLASLNLRHSRPYWFGPLCQETATSTVKRCKSSLHLATDNIHQTFRDNNNFANLPAFEVRLDFGGRQYQLLSFFFVGSCRSLTFPFTQTISVTISSAIRFSSYSGQVLNGST